MDKSTENNNKDTKIDYYECMLCLVVLPASCCSKCVICTSHTDMLPVHLTCLH